jgi:hypothetical protein
MVLGAHDIGDISSPDELIGYATRAQLALVRQEASQNTIALAIGMAGKRGAAGANLAHALRDGSLSDEKLQKLDETIVALASPNLVHTGGLSSLAIRLRGFRDRGSLSDRVPPSWAREILQQPADNEFAVLTQASALLSAFLAAESIDRADPRSRVVKVVHDRYHDEIVRVVDRLIVVGSAPPTPRNVEALIMLGTLGSYAFDIMKPLLEDALKRPLGFRVWRAITKLVMLSRATSPFARDLRIWVAQLLENAEELRAKSIYPARSLDLELAIVIPHGWSPPENDWVGRALLVRANSRHATVRERGTAAMGLWQRAVEDGKRDREDVAQTLRPIVAEFERPEERPDAYLGTQWVAATLKHVIARDAAVCNDWPENVHEPWLQHVDDALRHLDRQGIPDHILPGTRTLFQHTLLQNAGVYRRHAIETLLAGGWTEPVTNAFSRFLELEETEAWIRIRALFALGFLQHRDRGVERALATACQNAYKNIISGSPTPAQINEMHTVLFAIGDCFGASGINEDDVRRARESIHDILVDFVIGPTATATIPLYPISRAIAYLLAFTALPRCGNSGDLDLAEKLLGKLRSHPDEITRELADWALEFRIGDSGEILPLVQARI